MYNIHKQAQSEKKANKKSKENSKENLVEKDGEKIQPPVIITINDESEPSAAEKKKRTQEDLVTDFVKILEQMMNPRQAVTSFLGGASGLLSLITASIYCSSIPDNAQQTKQLVIILIVYGIIQMFMAISFFSTCMSTSIAVHRGVKHASQILFGLLVALAYAIFSIIAIFVGILGFYRTLCLVQYVEYTDAESAFYCPRPVFYASIFIFILHIVLIVTKCCCCK
ncbi:hypothetical protein WR25_18399 [Diploscapter pachys]|uniref:Uncharacterized protein n=1 Tax=Diploscapter pachys TaxID=2018661 RepID=A0A2A2JZL5_9BILA|nr:hypothetical protein WR25_18399 [Diploscapter pachys]